MCKADANGEAPIEISVTLNGVRKFFGTSLKCSPKTFKTKPPRYVVKYLDSLRVNLSQTIADMTALGIPLTAEKLRNAIQKGGLQSYTIADCFDDYFKILRKKVRNKQIKEVVAKRYYFLRTLLEKKMDFSREITDLTPAVVENFFLDVKPKYQESTLAGMMTRFKTVVKYAMDNGKLKINPFQNIHINKHQKDITYLTEEEINKIANLPIENKSLADVRDLFILECSCGLAYTDVAHLTKDDIKIQEDGTHVIIKNRQKTNVQFTTIVLPWGVEVLKRHNYKLRIISNQKINAMLKTIQTMAGITTNCTTHLARRSFATYLLCNKRVRAEVVSKALGHSSVRQTLSAYAKLIDTQVIDELKGCC